MLAAAQGLRKGPCGPLEPSGLPAFPAQNTTLSPGSGPRAPCSSGRPGSCAQAHRTDPAQPLCAQFPENLKSCHTRTLQAVASAL